MISVVSSFLAVLLLLQHVQIRLSYDNSQNAACSRSCSGHGYCRDSSCECFPGFIGVDCSVRVCPAGTAWADFPSANNTAHANFTECSNMGTCDRKTGICTCGNGFGGAACDKILCPLGLTSIAALKLFNDTAPCSGNGRCLSLREITNFQDFETNLAYESYKGWDMDMIHGCLCDRGFEGAACDKRSCPVGDDPMTPGVDEIQLIDCKCSICKGGLRISFNGYQTQLIPYDAAEELISYRLHELPSIGTIEVRFMKGRQMCTAQGSITRITFRLPQGPQNSLVVAYVNGLDRTHANDISVRTKGRPSTLDHSIFSTRGTKEYAECSNRGLCNYVTGVCECFGGYSSSDGLGNFGNIADCGYQNSDTFNYTVNGTTIITSCPYKDGLICSGNGVCNEGTGKCTCIDGYDDPACSSRTCLSSFSWFGNVGTDHSSKSICAGVGDCDRETGKCINCGGNWGTFAGDRCEYLSCYKDEFSKPCSGNGACLSLSEMALLTYNDQKEIAGIFYNEPWDSNLIRGCACLRAISVDNQYDLQYEAIRNELVYNSTLRNYTQHFSDKDFTKFYRGPFAFSATDFKGYDCKSSLCPKGDDPSTTGVNEIQKLVCRADNGSFFLTFRENTTLPISVNATAMELKEKLEQLYTISKVAITIENYDNRSVCSADGNSSVYIEFLTEFGDLPLLKSNAEGIINISPALGDGNSKFVMNITEVQKGTKEDVECSSQGICDERRGICECSPYYTSSNGTTFQAGERGDCTFYNPLYTEAFKKNKR